MVKIFTQVKPYGKFIRLAIKYSKSKIYSESNKLLIYLIDPRIIKLMYD